MRFTPNAAGAAALLSCAAVLTGTSALQAGDVTYERLLKPEPQNWLMNHRDFGSHRFSPLDTINKSNVKNLKLAFAVALGGTSPNEYIEATPLVDDGFMFITDVWGAVYKIDVRSGTHGRILWKMDPGQKKPDRNRGVALWNNLVISVTGLDGRVIATDKETGKIVWDTNLHDQDGMEISAAPLVLKDSVIIGGSGGDNGVRCWLASLDAKTGKLQWKTFAVPAPGEPGSETWKDKANAWETGGGAFYVTGSYDPATNLTYWGSGNPAPRYDSAYRPGDNLFTNSSIAFDAATGKMQWYFQHTANDNRDYDSSGSQIIIDGKVNRRGSQAARACQPQWLSLRARPAERPVPEGGAVFRQGHLDQGHRSQDRQAGRLRSQQGRAELRAALEGRHRRAQGRVPGRARRHQFLAAGL